MGKPVWILLPHLADWRWMQRRETTPWYPTARLLRQSKPDDWAGLVERAIRELNSLRKRQSDPRISLARSISSPPSRLSA
jgi:hypothetical protein